MSKPFGKVCSGRHEVINVETLCESELHRPGVFFGPDRRTGQHGASPISQQVPKGEPAAAVGVQLFFQYPESVTCQLVGKHVQRGAQRIVTCPVASPTKCYRTELSVQLRRNGWHFLANEFLDIASIDVVLSTTRSVRRRLDFDRAVPLEVIHDCVNLATQAPTGLGGESWRFMVVVKPEKKRSLAALYKTVLMNLARERGIEVKATQLALVDRLHEIPAMIFVCTRQGRLRSL